MIIPNGYAQVNLNWGGTSLPNGAQTTFGVQRVSSGESPAQVGALVHAHLVTANVRNVLTTTTRLQSILVKFGPNATGPSAVTVGTIVGQQSGESVPPNTAALIHKTTAFGGRAGRGRMYLPGIQDTTVGADGGMNPTIAATITGQWEAFRALMEGDDFPLVLLHGTTTGPIEDPIRITALACDGRAATQRRRLRK